MTDQDRLRALEAEHRERFASTWEARAREGKLRYEAAEARLRALEAENKALRAEVAKSDMQIAILMGDIETLRSVSDPASEYWEQLQVTNDRNETLAKRVTVLEAALRQLAEWCDSRERDTFRHRYKDDEVIYTPYRVMAGKVRDVLALHPEGSPAPEGP